jgi:hypothetical protein
MMPAPLANHATIAARQVSSIVATGLGAQTVSRQSLSAGGFLRPNAGGPADSEGGRVTPGVGHIAGCQHVFRLVRMHKVRSPCCADHFSRRKV